MVNTSGRGARALASLGGRARGVERRGGEACRRTREVREGFRPRAGAGRAAAPSTAPRSDRGGRESRRDARVGSKRFGNLASRPPNARVNRGRTIFFAPILPARRSVEQPGAVRTHVWVCVFERLNALCKMRTKIRTIAREGSPSFRGEKSPRPPSLPRRARGRSRRARCVARPSSRATRRVRAWRRLPRAPVAEARGVTRARAPPSPPMGTSALVVLRHVAAPFFFASLSTRATRRAAPAAPRVTAVLAVARRANHAARLEDANAAREPGAPPPPPARRFEAEPPERIESPRTALRGFLPYGERILSSLLSRPARTKTSSSVRHGFST